MSKDAFRRFTFPQIGSNMYVLAANGEALVIDPHISEDALSYLRDEGTQKVTVLLTHEHYDHTSGLPWLSRQFPCRVICHEATAASLREGKNNRPAVFASHLAGVHATEEERAYVRSLPSRYRYDVDIEFYDEYRFEWRGLLVRMISVPGHSPGSCCIELGSNVVATGDSLIYDTPVITKFPGGSAEAFAKCAVPYLRKIAEDTWILPGHGRSFFFHERTTVNRAELKE